VIYDVRVTTRDLYERIWSTVERIPSGRVATYGQIADLAGLPRRARLVGRALKELPDERTLPWHRVLRSPGRIAFARGTSEYREQRERLAAEGVLFDGAKIDLKRYGWSDALDALLWGAPPAPKRMGVSGDARSRGPRGGRSGRVRRA
jgi:methylated-DNA-protein-cysteine methyltransferase related protein